MPKGRALRDALRQLWIAYGALSETRRPCGAPLSLPHAYAFLELLHASSPMTISRLSQKLDIDRTNVSRLCARMAQAGELIFQTDPKDARAKVLRLTLHGQKIAQSIEQSSAQHFTALALLLDDKTDFTLDALQYLQCAMLQQKEQK